MWMSKNLGKRQDTKTWNIFASRKSEIFLARSKLKYFFIILPWRCFSSRRPQDWGKFGQWSFSRFLDPFFSNLIIWRIWHIYMWLQFLTFLCLIPDIACWYLIQIISKLIFGSHKSKLPSVFGKFVMYFLLCPKRTV